MDGIVAKESKKRRLPMWMLGVSAADQVKKSKSGEVNDVNKIEKEETAAECMVKKSRGRRRSTECEKEVDAPCEDALDEEQSNLAVKRQIVTRKKKDVVSANNEAEEEVVEKKSKRCVGRKVVQKSVGRRREKRESKGCESSEYIEAASPNEDDEDLTMDDLISIANEFVKYDKDRGQQKKSDAEQIVHKQCAPTDISRNEPADSIVTSVTVRRSPAHEETTSCHSLSCTGDPAQDMLDLLLGPLFTQPLKEEKKADIITDDMIIAHQIRKQNQKADTHDIAIPLAKKKTSLKDKVAMFLD